MTVVSIIIPVLDEAATIGERLSDLGAFRDRSVEIIVVDGGSRDATASVAEPLCDRLLVAPRGRAAQMNAGAAIARGDVLLFLHADTSLPADAPERIVEALRDCGRTWGRFDVRISGRSRWLPVISRMMNLRSRLTGIATGDQAIFVRRDVFAAAGGFEDLPLMEDIALCRALRASGSPACLRGPVVTSGRRWDTHGALTVMLLMWRLRAEYFFGADPRRLARRYGYVPRD